MKRSGGNASALLVLAAVLAAPLPAQQAGASDLDPIEPAAIEALKQMGAYLRTLESFQVRAESTSEEVLTDGQKLQFAQNSNLLADRPNRLMAEVDGDLNSRLYVFDGNTFTFFARDAGYYATVAAPATITELTDILDEKYNIQMPLVDLFRWGGPNSSVVEITDAADIGPSQIEGVSCAHYAFRQPGLDWQIWIQMGDHPLPRKLVLTTTTDEARPQYTSVLSWNLAPSFNDAAFTFTPPPGVSKIVFAEDAADSAGGRE